MADSPPPTPSSSPPAKGEGRFKPMTTPCEWIEDYRPGKYLPVHFRDVFKDRYKVICKLGVGSFSTVWLAHDLKSHRYVALKILVASATKTSKELKILQHLAEDVQPAGSKHVVELLDDFKHTLGPNGTHLCLVFEPMGPSVNSMVENLPCFKPNQSGMTVRYPMWMAKRILRQVLQGLVFLHRNGITHGDLQQGNILFTLKDLSYASDTDDKLQQDENYKWRSISPLVQRKDGKIDKWAPRYLAIPQPLDQYANISPSFKVKLSDMGGAYFISEPPKTLVTPLGLRAPELIIGGNKVNKTLDVCAFRCLVFEIITGRPLFYVHPYDNPDDATDDHLLMLSDSLGPLPDHLYALWTRSSRYYTNRGVQFNTLLYEPSDGTDLLANKMKPLEEFFDEHRAVGVSDEEARTVKATLRWILQYDPAKRPTPSQILWFSEESIG